MRAPTSVAVVLAVAGLVITGCIAPPGDAAQIRRLLRDEADASARGDRDALYRMRDPDFRAICPAARFVEVSDRAPQPAIIEASELRGARGWATLARGDERERRPLIKDAGRWYLYADAAECRRDG
jgi:hypothetical protein